jgi:hypothetical protein
MTDRAGTLPGADPEKLFPGEIPVARNVPELPNDPGSFRILFENRFIIQQVAERRVFQFLETHSVP